MEPYADNAPELNEIAFQPTRLAAGLNAAIRDITETEMVYLRDSILTLSQNRCV